MRIPRFLTNLSRDLVGAGAGSAIALVLYMGFSNASAYVFPPGGEEGELSGEVSVNSTMVSQEKYDRLAQRARLLAEEMRMRQNGEVAQVQVVEEEDVADIILPARTTQMRERVYSIDDVKPLIMEHAVEPEVKHTEVDTLADSGITEWYAWFMALSFALALRYRKALHAIVSKNLSSVQ